MKKIFLLIGTLLLTVCAAFSYSMPRWGMTAVDVYIPEHEYKSVVENVFNQWSQATGGKMRFRFNSTRFASNNAPIKVSFKDERAPYYQVTSKRSETTGYFTNMDEGYINRASVNVYLKNRDNKEPNITDIETQLLTEIGYILGLEKIYGNCPTGDYASIMCVQLTKKEAQITDWDKQQIQEKYTRSSDNIQKPKKLN